MRGQYTQSVFRARDDKVVLTLPRQQYCLLSLSLSLSYILGCVAVVKGDSESGEMENMRTES